jgi:formylglycine-generating enzyme
MRLAKSIQDTAICLFVSQLAYGCAPGASRGTLAESAQTGAHAPAEAAQAPAWQAAPPGDLPTQLKPASLDESSLAEVDSGPQTCPDDMQLVEGEYCTSIENNLTPDAQGNTPGGGAKDIEVVERECLKEWYAPQNKKRVCEEFATKGVCTGKMIKKRFCMDRYAWPNKKGHKSEVMNRFHQAQVKCAAVSRRLCTESEWTFACEGPTMKPFPYGYIRDAKKCHGDEEWDSPNMTKVAQRDQKELRRLDKTQPSGQPECVSDFGVYDLPGDTDEIVASETTEAGWRGKYDSVHTGGPWYKGVRNQCRPKIYTHDEGFYYYFLGFRCCQDAGSEPTDPLTPRQKAEGWDMKRVERSAGITVQEMREILEKKKTDPSCGCTTTRCRTFCGTLLGDEAERRPSPPNSR